jgi:hypothetical protein
MVDPLINQAVKSCRCARCQSELYLVDVRGVGVRKPDETDPASGKPVLFVLIDCAGCGLRNTAHTTTPLNAVMEAVLWMYETAEIKKQIIGDGKTIPVRRTLDCRPSIRKWQPRHPFSEREVKSFLRLLSTTSMRRNTKSFAKFMKKLKATPADHDLTDNTEEDGDETCGT